MCNILPNNNRIVASFSCGAASAVATKMAVEKYGDRVIVIYCDTLKYEHPDNLRFMKDVEKWIGKDITLLSSEKYTDIFDVFNKTGWLVGRAGARCTTELKKNVAKKFRNPGDINIMGLTADEGHRIDRFEDQNPEIGVEWILRDSAITKSDCYKILTQAGIRLPKMYELGYNNNNCIGCVKGSMGYWNKIRIDFPLAFKRMAQQERKMGVAINKSFVGGTRRSIFLDELDPNAGRDVPLPDIECGVMCIKNEVEYDTISIYDNV